MFYYLLFLTGVRYKTKSLKFLYSDRSGFKAGVTKSQGKDF